MPNSKPHVKPEIVSCGDQHGVGVSVLRKNHEVVDVDAALTDEQYRTLLLNFDDKQATWNNACYTYLYQNQLAAFNQKCIDHPEYKSDVAGISSLVTKMRGWSETYADFEEMVNNPPAGPDPLGVLIDRLTQQYTYMKKQGLPAAMCQQVVDFIYAATKLRNKPASPAEIKQFFSIQEEDPNMPYLGKFLRDQLLGLTRFSQDEVYERIYKNGTLLPRFMQMFFMHPLLKNLSDAEANIEKRGKSIYGERYMSHRATPKSMITAMRSEQTTASKPGEQLTTSLMDRFDRPRDVLEADRMLRVISSRDPANPTPYTGSKPKARHHALVVFASVWEFVFYSLPRLGISLALGVVNIGLQTALTVAHLGLSVLTLGFGYRPLKPFFDNARKTVSKVFKGFDKGLSTSYKWISEKFGIVGAKSLRNKQYSGIDSDLREKLGNPISYYDVMLSFVGSEKVGEYFTSFASNIGNTFVTAWNNFSSLFRGDKTKQINALQQDIEKAWIKRFNELQNKQENQGKSITLKGTSASEAQPLLRESIEHINPNEIASFLDFFDEMGVGLADVVIGPMFRKSPGAATFFFILANASFGALTFPAVFGATASMLSTPTGWIAMHFMGKATGTQAGASMMNNLMASFLQWKLSFFPVEAGLEFHHDKDLLGKMLHDSERLTLAMAAMIGLGYAMHFVHTIPKLPTEISAHDLGINNSHFETTNYLAEAANGYVSVANLFCHESLEVTEYGTAPFTGLEYAFLGVKSIMLVHSLLHTSNAHEKLSGIQKVFKEHKENGKDHSTYPVMQEVFKAMRERLKGRSLSTLTEADKQAIIRPALDEVCRKNNIVLNDIEKAQVIGIFYSNASEAAKQAQAAYQQAQTNVANLENPNTIESKRFKLMNAIQTVDQMEMMHKSFKTSKEARDYYDYLYHAFKDYNNEQRKLGNWDKQLDKERFLHAFYNKHCFKHTSPLLMFISIVPFLPVRMAWRAMLSFSKSPATQYDLKKSYAQDRVVGMQILAILGRVLHVALLSYTYLVRAVIMSPVLPMLLPIFFQNAIAAASNYLFGTQFKRWTPPKWLDSLSQPFIKVALWIAPYENMGSYFRAVRNLFPGVVKVTGQHGKAAKIADTKHDHLKAESTALIKQLMADSSKQSDEDTWLKGYPRQHEKPASLFSAAGMKNLFSFKQARKDEKENLKRYASGMQGLDDRIKGLLLLAEGRKDNQAIKEALLNTQQRLYAWKKEPSLPKDDAGIKAGCEFIGELTQVCDRYEKQVKALASDPNPVSSSIPTTHQTQPQRVPMQNDNNNNTAPFTPIRNAHQQGSFTDKGGTRYIEHTPHTEAQPFTLTAEINKETNSVDALSYDTTPDTPDARRALACEFIRTALSTNLPQPLSLEGDPELVKEAIKVCLVNKVSFTCENQTLVKHAGMDIGYKIEENRTSQGIMTYAGNPNGMNDPHCRVSNYELKVPTYTPQQIHNNTQALATSSPPGGQNTSHRNSSANNF